MLRGPALGAIAQLLRLWLAGPDAATTKNKRTRVGESNLPIANGHDFILKLFMVRIAEGRVPHMPANGRAGRSFAHAFFVSVVETISGAIETRSTTTLPHAGFGIHAATAFKKQTLLKRC